MRPVRGARARVAPAVAMCSVRAARGRATCKRGRVDLGAIPSPPPHRVLGVQPRWSCRRPRRDRSARWRPPARCVPRGGARPRALRTRTRKSWHRCPGPVGCSAAAVFLAYCGRCSCGMAGGRAGSARSASAATRGKPAPPARSPASLSITCEIGVGSDRERCVGRLRFSHPSTQG